MLMEFKIKDKICVKRSVVSTNGKYSPPGLIFTIIEESLARPSDCFDLRGSDGEVFKDCYTHNFVGYLETLGLYYAVKR